VRCDAAEEQCRSADTLTRDTCVSSLLCVDIRWYVVVVVVVVVLVVWRDVFPLTINDDDDGWRRRAMVCARPVRGGGGRGSEQRARRERER
jgi:hypothetical protein